MYEIQTLIGSSLEDYKFLALLNVLSATKRHYENKVSW